MNPEKQGTDIRYRIKATIAIIDDDPALVKLLQRKLHKTFVPDDLKVVVAHDGEAGVRIIERELPDLVFLDVEMPGLRGPDVLSRIRKSDRSLVANVYIIMLTAMSDVKTVMESTYQGANEYLVKPFKPADLMLRIINFFISKRLAGE